MDCILVQGLRPQGTDSDGRWFERLTDAINERWPVPAASAATQCLSSASMIIGQKSVDWGLRVIETERPRDLDEWASGWRSG